MKVKSMEELRRIREAHGKNLNMRQGEHEKRTIVKVGMGTCGIAAGARETLRAIMDEIERQDMKNIDVIQVGCNGYCHSEPIVEVVMPDEGAILYGNVDEAKGREIVTKHLKGKELLQDSIVNETFERA